METVFIGFEHYYDGVESWKSVAKVFSSQDKAINWRDEVEISRVEWRSIEEHEVR